MKPYQQIPISECGEPLVSIPLEKFAVMSPHPYEKLGANYQGKSPYYLRKRVVNALLQAQTFLQQNYPGTNILIFDAYRPVAVQQFMVDYTFASVVKQQGLTPEQLSEAEKQAIWQQVYQIWAVPSENPATPPPHSTGAAVDITLIDETGAIIDMGGQIDEMSERSQPNYYAQSIDVIKQNYHQKRELLKQIMINAGFSRHPGEWWHFSLGDQMWAWETKQAIAYYGRKF
ncbi:M15 family metallopeptidase [Aphanothece sacrum]|uniref:D-alanyl-D-alanine dipeptidase n=1 Tax=Aphanothece sacrum FPU1 TaxID=1920663 RepID=A0A401IFC9_APHSA|nr:M15 family metallopeptidase [Aphanothece sacrum]GBF79931.1 peptidase [Aphanothece sacrum FPU1]GBF83849.1 peptidase [Aphanothece sacrum FPU3]